MGRRVAGRHRRTRRQARARSSRSHYSPQSSVAGPWDYAPSPHSDPSGPATPFPTAPFVVHGRGGRHRRSLARRILNAFVDFG